MAEPAAATGVAATRGGRAAGAVGDVKPRKKARAGEPAAGPSPTPPPARRSVAGGRATAGAAATTAVASAAAVADGTGALAGGVPTVPGLGGAGAATEELAFFDELRGVLGDGSTHLYADFIKCLSLFSRHIISRDELLRLADDIFTDSHKHLTDAFRALLASSAPSAPLAATAHLRSLPRPTPSPPTPAGGGPSAAAVAPGALPPPAPSAAIYRGRRLADVAVSRGKKEGSYWEMPADYVPPVASGMGDLEREVLNTRYVAAPGRRHGLLRPTPPASSVSSAPGVESPAPVPPPPPPAPTASGRPLVGAAAAAAAGAAAAAAATAAAASTAAGGVGASTADGGSADGLLPVGGGESAVLCRTRVVPDDDRYELDVLIAGVEAAAVKFAKLAALAASSHEASSTAATIGPAVGAGAASGTGAAGGGGGAGAAGAANGNAALSPVAAAGGGASGAGAGAGGASGSGGAWATLTAVDFHALDMVYGRHGRAVVDFVRLNPVLAAPVVLARLRTQLASWKHARRQLGGVWRTEPFRSSSSLTGALARSASGVNIVEQQSREGGEPPPAVAPSGDDVGSVVVTLPGGAVTVHNNGCMDTPELVGSLLSTRRYGGFWMYSYVRCAPDYLLARRLLWDALEWQLRDGDGAAAVAVTVWLDGFLDSLLGGGGDESDVVSDATAAAPASPNDAADGNEKDGGTLAGAAAHAKRVPGCDASAADGETGDVRDGLTGGTGVAGSAAREPDAAAGSSGWSDGVPSPPGAAAPGAMHVLYGDVPLYTVVRLTAALCDKLHVVNALPEEVRERLLQLLTDALCGRLTIPLYTTGLRSLLHLPEAGGATAGLGATATTFGDNRGDASAGAGEAGIPAVPASAPTERIGNGDAGAPSGRASEKSDAGDTIGSPSRGGGESAMDVDAGEGVVGVRDDIKPALLTVESFGIAEADATALFNLPLVASTWAVAVMRVALSPTPTTSALLELHTNARQVDESIYLVRAAASMASSGSAPPSAASSAAGPSPLVRIAYDAGAVALHFHAVPHASTACAACTAPRCVGDCDGSRLLGGAPRGGGTPSVDSSAFVEGRPRAGISAEASEALAASAFASFLRRLRRVPGSRRLRIGAAALRSPPPEGAIGSVAARLVHRAESVVLVNGLKLSSAVAAGVAPRSPAWGSGGGGEDGGRGGGGDGGSGGKRRGRLVGRRFVPEGGEDSMYVPRPRPLGRRPTPQPTGSAALERLCSRAAGGRVPLHREAEAERDGAAA